MTAKKNANKFVVFSIVDFLFCILSFFLGVPGIFTLCILLWMISIEYTLFDLMNRAAFLLFEISFFVFLLGSEFVIYYFNYKETYIFTDIINNHTYLCLCISLIGLFIGFAISNNFCLRNTKKILHINNLQQDYLEIQHLALVGMLITVIPYFTEALASGFYVFKNGYLSYYVSYISPLPKVVLRLSEIFTLFLFMYLATMPSKRKTLPWLTLYITQSMIMLLTGRRLYFGMAVFVTATYFLIRHKKNPAERWITRKIICTTLISIPILIILLYMYKYARYGQDVVGHGFFDLLIRFFNQQGFSINVIKYAKKFEGDQLGNVSLYYTLSFLRRSGLTRKFFNFPIEYYKLRNQVSAFNLNSLADYIMYSVSPSQYAAGYGYGTSYIAELFHDGGYGLVFIGSVFYGFLLSKLYNMKTDNAWRMTIALMMLEQFMVLPRYGADCIMRPFYSISKISILVLCIFIVNLRIHITLPIIK